MSESSWRRRIYAIAVAAILALLWSGASSASALAAGSIEGTVVEDGSGEPLNGICVNAQLVGGGFEIGTQTDPDGLYAIENLDPGDYRVQFVACEDGAGSRGSHVTEYFDDSQTFGGATLVSVTDGPAATANASLAPAGVIEGVVTEAGTGQPLEGICVRTDPDNGDGADETDASGSYSISGLPAGTYKVRFFGCTSAENYLPQWFDGAGDAASATDVAVSAGGTSGNIDAVLEPGAKISGTITSEETDEPLDGACAFAHDGGGNGPPVTSAITSDGDYELVGLPGGTYWIRFAGCAGNHVGEYYEESRTLEDATPVTVADGGAVGGIDGTLGPGGTITGTVTGSLGVGAASVCIDARSSATGATVARAVTEIDGQYVLNGLPAGTYVVRFEDCGVGNRFGFQYYPQQPSRAAATPVAVSVGQTRTGINAQMSAPATIEGTVTAAAVGPLDGVCVNAFEPTGDPASSTATDPDGSYVLGGLASGSYRVQFDPGCDDLDYATEYYEDSIDEANAELVTVAAPGGATGIDAEVEPELTGPRVAIPSGPPPATRNRRPIFTLSVGGSATDVACSLVAVGEPDAFGPCSGGSTSHQPATDLGEGDYVFKLMATDADGRSNTAERLFTVDTIAPALQIDSAPATRSTDTQPDFAFTAEPGTTVRCSIQPGTGLNLGPCSGGSASHTPAQPLADGTYTFAVRAIDAAGNATTQTEAFEVDTTGPVTAISEGPEGPTNEPRPTFEFSADSTATALTCRLLADAVEVDSRDCLSETPYTPASDLADGEYTFVLEGADDLGNDSVLERDFTVDTVAPDAQISNGPDARSSDPRPSFSFGADPGDTLECSLVPQGESAAFGACSGTGSHQPADDLADGTYSFAVRATDPAGNLGVPASTDFEVDTTAPSLAIDEEPAALTNDSTPAFAFTAGSDADVVECRLDGGATPTFSDCSSGAYEPTVALVDGEHVFEVRAADDLGNVRSELRTFTVDTEGPEVSLTDAPGTATSDATPAFSFETEAAATVECSLEAVGVEGYGPCSEDDAHVPAQPLADGVYTFAVRATDAAGNLGEAETLEFEVDTTAPTLTVTEEPADPTNDATPLFEFEAGADAAALECRIFSGAAPAWTDCSAASSFEPDTALPDGDYIFEVRASDSLANQAVRQRSFTLDTLAPTLAITGGPSGVTTDATPSFTFNAEAGATIECSIERTGSQGFGACTTGSSFDQGDGLAEGDWDFTVRATDAAGNQATAVRTFSVVNETAPPEDPPPAQDPPPADDPVPPQFEPPVNPPVDTTAPTVRITAGPKGKTKDTTPTFSFSSNDGAAKFACRVDSTPERSCGSPFTSVKLKPGKHQITVVAIDAAGNRSTAATQAFTVQKKKKKRK